MTDVYVGCGSNIEPARHLRRALDELARQFGSLRCSSVYRSPAYGFEGPDFLNLVVRFSAGPDADADAVEAVLSAIENRRGRDPGRRSGSRTIDLDLLLLGQRVDPGRRLPRADVLRYPFVLAPLAEIAPGLVHPVTGSTMGRSWRDLAPDAGRLTRLDGLDAA